MLNDAVKLFLEDVAVKEAIRDMDIEEVYRLAGSNLSWQLTSYFVNDVGFDPLEYLTVVPSYYMQQEMKLKTLTIPGNVKTVKHNAFNHCYNLIVVNVEEGVETIEPKAFYLATIQKLKLPRSIKSFYLSSMKNPGGEIEYAGTIEEFKLRFGHRDFSAYKVMCSDGQYK